MKDRPVTDREILNHIEQLMTEEQDLHAKPDHSEEEKRRIAAIEVELDRYWDLLRQRRALRRAGKNPDQAELRGPEIVENYEQ